MSAEELLVKLKEKDVDIRKFIFDKYYSRLSAIALRYCKNSEQANEAFTISFNDCLNKLLQHKQPQTINFYTFLEKEFILGCVTFIRNIRSEYYVSSTVYATDAALKNYNLFENNEWIDFNQVEMEILIKSLQQMVPSQRLIFNLHVVDAINLSEAASILESSEATVKSNLEKARYNLQKNIEKNLKSIKI